MHPLIGVPLPPAEQAPLDPWEAVSLQGGQQAAQPVCGSRQGTMRGHAKAASRPGVPIQAPRGPMPLECRLKRCNQRLALVEGQAGQSAKRCGAAPHVGALDTGQTACLLAWAAQYIIKRDKLNCIGSWVKRKFVTSL